MKATVHRWLTWAVVALSVIHIGATPLIFDTLKSSLGWFVGVGLMGLFLAFLNFIAARKPEDRTVVRFCHAANALAALFACGTAVIDRNPLTYVVIGLFIGVLLSAPRLPARKA